MATRNTKCKVSPKSNTYTSEEIGSSKHIYEGLRLIRMKPNSLTVYRSSSYPIQKYYLPASSLAYSLTEDTLTVRAIYMSRHRASAACLSYAYASVRYRAYSRRETTKLSKSSRPLFAPSY